MENLKLNNSVIYPHKDLELLGHTSRSAERKPNTHMIRTRETKSKEVSKTSIQRVVVKPNSNISKVKDIQLIHKHGEIKNFLFNILMELEDSHDVDNKNNKESPFKELNDNLAEINLGNNSPIRKTKSRSSKPRTIKEPMKEYPMTEIQTKEIIFNVDSSRSKEILRGYRAKSSIYIL